MNGGDGGVGSAREHQVEKRDVTGLALGQAGGEFDCLRLGGARRRHVALANQDLRLARVGHRKTRVGRERSVEGFDRTGVKCQRPIAALNVGIACTAGGS